MVVHHIICSFWLCKSSIVLGIVTIVRIRSTTPVRLLHAFGLLPSGITGKMTVTLDTTTIFALLVVSMLAMSRCPPLVSQASQITMISL